MVSAACRRPIFIAMWWRPLLARIGKGRRWQTWIAIAPDMAVAGRYWPANVGRVPQGGGDLGQRMQRVLDRRPAGAIVIIGTDCPAIRQSDIATAFRALAANSVVIGPSPDGGYWLIGAQRTFGRLKPFGNVRWSSADALSDTLRNLSHVSVAKLRILTDVDTETEWRACRGWAGRCVLPANVERQRLCVRLSNS